MNVHNDGFAQLGGLLSQQIARAVMTLMRPILQEIKEDLILHLNPWDCIRPLSGKIGLADDPEFPINGSTLRGWQHYRETNGWDEYGVSSVRGKKVYIDLHALYRWLFDKKMCEDVVLERIDGYVQRVDHHRRIAA